MEWIAKDFAGAAEQAKIDAPGVHAKAVQRNLSFLVPMLVDGGSEWTVFRRLIVPLSKPVLATLSIYDGLNVWNNFILPLVLTQSNSVAVLPLGLTKLEGQYAINVPAVMAAVLLSVLPLVVLFVVMRKQVMRSLGSVVMR